MTRWIDMTDAQKGALHQRMVAKERAAVIANPSRIIKALAQIDAEAAEIAAEGGKSAAKRVDRWLDEKQPIYDRLERLGINPADIGVTPNQRPEIRRQRARLAETISWGDIEAVARLHGKAFADALVASAAAVSDGLPKGGGLLGASVRQMIIEHRLTNA